jgi:hypothetical protein
MDHSKLKQPQTPPSFLLPTLASDLRQELFTLSASVPTLCLSLNLYQHGGSPPVYQTIQRAK